MLRSPFHVKRWTLSAISVWSRWLSRHLLPSNWRVRLVLPTSKTALQCIYIPPATGHFYFRGEHQFQFLSKQFFVNATGALFWNRVKYRVWYIFCGLPLCNSDIIFQYPIFVIHWYDYCMSMKHKGDFFFQFDSIAGPDSPFVVPPWYIHTIPDIPYKTTSSRRYTNTIKMLNY